MPTIMLIGSSYYTCCVAFGRNGRIGYTLYFFRALFCFGEWHSLWFLSRFHDLRQGDPLSPLLFVRVTKALSKMLFATVDGCFFSGSSVGSRNSRVIYSSYLPLGAPFKAKAIWEDDVLV
jgi:hypothetical protein